MEIILRFIKQCETGTGLGSCIKEQAEKEEKRENKILEPMQCSLTSSVYLEYFRNKLGYFFHISSTSCVVM
jgi:hypothetical protein